MNDIERFRNRRARRIAARFDGGFISFVYGWLRRNGVDTKGMEPGDAIAEYNDMRGGEGGNGDKPVTASSKVRETKVGSFVKSLKQAKDALPEDKRWRVDNPGKGGFTANHPNGKFYQTSDGATFGVDKGDIIGVSAIPKEMGGVNRGRAILEAAVKKGGNKLDSYAGNHAFYVKCGFEPVSWCEWDGEYAPPGWTEGRDDPEPVIFYKYVGRGKVKASDNYLDFTRSVKPQKDYDEAYAERDKRL